MNFTGQKDNSTNPVGSRAFNLNNYVWNSNWNNGFVAVCEHLNNMYSLIVKALVVRPLKQWSAFCPTISKYITRSVKVGVSLREITRQQLKGNN